MSVDEIGGGWRGARDPRGSVPSRIHSEVNLHTAATRFPPETADIPFSDGCRFPRQSPLGRS